MKKIVAIALTGMITVFGVASSYADIWVGMYGGSFTPKAGTYEAKIQSVVVGTSTTTDGNGKKTTKHNYVYVGTANNKGESVSFSFSGEDLQSGLAMMGAIGKNIEVGLDLDSKSYLVVNNIELK